MAVDTGPHGDAAYRHDSQHAHQHQQSYAHQNEQSSTYRESLTAQHLYKHNQYQAQVSKIDVWKNESQRDGPWYGSVQ